MRSVLLDLRYAFRVFRAHPGITAIAVLSLALGMGANSTIFSVVDGMYLRPLPVREPGSLVWISSKTPEGRKGYMNWLDYLDLKEAGGAFADIAVQNRRGGLIDNHGDAELVLITIVSDNFFPLLGVHAARGRLFRADLDAALTNEPAVAISDSLWRRLYGSDPALVGHTIRLNNHGFTVVGILAPDFHSLERGVRNDVWVPTSTWKAMGNAGDFEGRGGTSHWEPIARLRPGATLARGQAVLDAFNQRLQQSFIESRGRRLVGETQEMLETKRGLQPGTLLLAIVALLVLIACANVAILLLAQAEARKREIGIRIAMGAGAWRLSRQLLTEAALLAAAGGTLALLVSWWIVPLLPALLPPGPDFIRYDIRVDARVFVVTAVTCILTVLLFGLAPALAARRTDLVEVLKNGGRVTRQRFAGRGLLVAAQAALGVMLLTGAGLLARSFFHIQSQRPGFDANRNILTVLSELQGREAAVTTECDVMAERIRALPGVKSAAYCRRMPLSLSGSGATRNVLIPGRAAAPGDEVKRIRFNQVSPEYFAATGTRLLAGRSFTRADSASTAPVTLVNETMARQFWTNGGPIGQWIKVGGKDTQIVGVVENGYVAEVHEPPEAFLYVPFAQLPVTEVTMVVETAGEPHGLLDSVKREMRAVRPETIFLITSSLRQHLKDALYSDWVPAVLSATIGALGMLLAAAGLFGVVLHGVNRRARELGVRMALGARRSSVVGMVVRHGVVLAGIGALAGAGLALAGGRLLAGLLYGVSPYDPVTLAAAVAVVMAVAVFTSLYPAWKATRIDPAGVLRSE